ncbi:hypothetical protein B0J17DRAFT_723145 [Rhizoctonia solani]|nr:hypothetical protein B0J17DRAFT_723145 [Rhizoctonia solani]
MKRNAPPVPPSRSIFLPEEVLSEIFINAVYNVSDKYVMDFVIRRIASIYQRLQTLLAVCRAWQAAGLACPTLWTVVPFAESQTGQQRPLAAGLSLECAGRNDLHLAMSAWRFSAERFKALTGHWHRFSVINIWSNDEDSEDIHKALPKLLSTAHPKRTDVTDMFSRHYPLTEYEPSISRLISSLAVFRTNNSNINWSGITFTHRLIDLELTNINLYENSDVEAFFAALSSVKELKKPKLVFFIAHLGHTGVTMTKPSSTVLLPKLELLHLEHLHFNVLQFVLAVIAPGSYCLTLNPLEETFLDYVPGLQSGQPVSEDRVCTYLSTINVHKLIL